MDNEQKQRVISDPPFDQVNFDSLNLNDSSPKKSKKSYKWIFIIIVLVLLASSGIFWRKDIMSIFNKSDEAPSAEIKNSGIVDGMFFYNSSSLYLTDMNGKKIKELYSYQTPKTITSVNGSTVANSFRISPNNNYIAAYSQEAGKEMALIDLKAGTKQDIDLPTECTDILVSNRSLVWSYDSKSFYTTCDTPVVYQYELTKEKFVKLFAYQTSDDSDGSNMHFAAITSNQDYLFCYNCYKIQEHPWKIKKYNKQSQGLVSFLSDKEAIISPNMNEALVLEGKDLVTYGEYQIPKSVDLDLYSLTSGTKIKTITNVDYSDLGTNQELSMTNDHIVLFHSPEDNKTVQKVISIASGKVVATINDAISYPSISPDGNDIIYTMIEGSKIYLQNLKTNEKKLLPLETKIEYDAPIFLGWSTK